MAGMNYDDETLEQMQTEAEGRTEVAYPLNDTAYIAEDAQLWHATRTQGVYSADDHLTTRAEGGMQVAVSEGIAWLKKSRFENCVYGNKEEKTLTVETADGRLPRIDRAVIRWDKITNKVTSMIKTGTPATNPQPPALVRNAEAYELGIANIRVPAGALAITQANIQDTRLDEYACGIMRDGVTKIPTEQLYKQWEGWYKSTTSSAEKEINDSVGKLLEQIIVLDKKAGERYSEFVQELEQIIILGDDRFNNWLAEKDEILGTYPAGEVLAKIENLEKNDPAHTLTTIYDTGKENIDGKRLFKITGLLTVPLEKWGFVDAGYSEIPVLFDIKGNRSVVVKSIKSLVSDDWIATVEKEKIFLKSEKKKTKLIIS